MGERTCGCARLCPQQLFVLGGDDAAFAEQYGSTDGGCGVTSA